MELVKTSLPARVKQNGEEGGIVLTAGQTLTIETSPGGDEILSAEVPAGKQWTVTVSVGIDEVDA